jgi:hypothetical protein
MIEHAHESLAEALSALQLRLPTIAKTSMVEIAKGVKTNYADLATVSEAILPELSKHGLYFTSAPTLIGDRFVLRCELGHVTGGKVEAIYPLTGNGHHQIGSAITYGRRYCLGAMTGLTPEDDDGGAAAEAASAPRSAQRRTTKPAEAATAQRGARPALPSEAADPNKMTSTQRGKMHALFNQKDITERGNRLAYTIETIGRQVNSSDELTRAETDQVIDRLERWIAQDEPPADSEPAS